VKVLGIAASPRTNANSDVLLAHALEGAASAHAQTESLRLADYDIHPCTACDACRQTGRCVIQDDFPTLLTRILHADRLILASPVFFMNLCAQAKILIDRTQCLWALKYILNKPIPTPSSNRRAMLIAIGGSKSKKQFQCIKLTATYFFDVLQANYFANLFVSSVDAPGQIRNHPQILDQAFRLGAELASEPPFSDKPVDHLFP